MPDRPTRQDAENPKYRDLYIFVEAAEFFDTFSSTDKAVHRPTSVTCHDEDQKDKDGPAPSCSHGRIFRFDDGTCMLLQFMRPLVWRVKFSESFTTADYTDYNTRTIVQDTLTNTIKALDALENVDWFVELLAPDPAHYILQSVVKEHDSDKTRVELQLWIDRNPFKISAVRSIKPPVLAFPLPDSQPSSQGSKVTIWETDERGLAYRGGATVLSVKKSYYAGHVGFGEQGGKRLFKDNCFMNYFNFDNMRYQNVYGDGPYRDAEPLYHSEPYWLEVNTNPGYPSVVGTFIDNYSQVCVDLGKTNPRLTRMATRFNAFQGIFMAGDTVADIIRRYTSLVGGPWLMPRYVLGYHQGCYGYDTRNKVEEAVKRYRDGSYPLDGMHIDVDIQKEYQTFTINTAADKFPDPQAMFSGLRDKGVKCSTNITPFIYAPFMEGKPDSESWVYQSGARDNIFLKDSRELDPTVPEAWDQRYMTFGDGNQYLVNPNVWNQRPKFGDHYNFADVFNKGDVNGALFHGGVYYGDDRGKPGVYPNLNSDAGRKWWGQQYQYLFEQGLEFVWQDMTSPCMHDCYGDMKSLPFRLKLDSDGWSGDPRYTDLKQKAIEIWSLYSYNLHKATFQGLSDKNIAPTRVGKRNFIIGRGSFAGAQRFAGLWTGDNASTWPFLDISIAQVLALGMAGVSMAGADVGGFESKDGQLPCTDPELFIRWNTAYSLLPWYRNHYSAKGAKKFQEPYAYEDYYQNVVKDNPSFTDEQKNLFRSVQPIVRYFLKLRYSLMQLLYDALFESCVNRMPIARALFIADDQDLSLFSENRWYSRSQFLVRNDLLVAPVLIEESQMSVKQRGQRKVYLPWPCDWFRFNLRLDVNQGEALQPSLLGGSHVQSDTKIDPEDVHIPWVLPMFVRAGAIIPQIEPRDHVPDRTVASPEAANPITFHLYPGRDSSYDMYLDDGVSRNSAPSVDYLMQIRRAGDGGSSTSTLSQLPQVADPEALSRFRKVQVTQTQHVDEQGHYVRRVNIKTVHGMRDGPEATTYTAEEVKRDIGETYRLMFWHAHGTELVGASAVVLGPDKGDASVDSAKRATVVTVAVEAVDESKGVTVEVVTK